MITEDEWAEFMELRMVSKMTTPKIAAALDRAHVSYVASKARNSEQSATGPIARSPEELAKLKREWCADGCWDLEYTEGFEAHYDELLAFSNEYKAQVAAKTQVRLEKRAEQLGCPGNVKLVQYIEALEHCFDRLTERLECVETGMGFR